MLAADRAFESLKEKNWDFKDEDTGELTHGLHPYPARMVPQIARRLIKAYSEKGDLIYDPMCGSGTVLTEARLAGRNSVGVDINPHALLLAKVKSTPLMPSALRDRLEAIRKGLPTIESPDSPAVVRVDPPNLGIDLNFWFKESAIQGLARLKALIDRTVKESVYREFFYVPFSLTTRFVSNTRNGEFKLYRMAEDKLDKHDPDPASVFLRFAEDSVTRMRDFYGKTDRDVYSLPMRGDARVTSLFGRADCIVTSPPYGDSQTTVAYGQYSRLSAEWLGFRDVRSVDRLSLGGKTAKKENGLKSDSLTDALASVESKDHQRAGEVKSFFLDLDDCLLMMAESLRSGGVACIVIGNRTVKGVRIPTDRIIVELSSRMGLAHEGTISREISSKTMPLEISPTNVAGETESSMREEFIVILRRV